MAAIAALIAVALVPPATAAAAPRGVQPPSRLGATVARIVAPTTARARLASRPGRRWRVRTQTSWSAQQQSLLVLAAGAYRGREWVKVLLPDRPDGAAGWVQRDRVVLSRTPYWVAVDTSARRVTVYRDGRRLRSMRAVVGKPSTPTPEGLAAIYERNRQPDPHAFLGPWVLSLTALSNTLRDFGGGPGRIGIHGRDGASLLDPLGSARSHGCVRIEDREIRWMASHLPVGTPVQIGSARARALGAAAGGLRGREAAATR